ncbi:MAG: metallophosphoesterase family protein [Pseudomonadota bacterium]
MRIGVMSDTHLHTPDAGLDHILNVVLADVDMILHAGDIVTRRVLQHMEQSNVIAVCGNMDDYDIAGEIPQMRIIPAQGIKIGLIHGWGSKDGLQQRIISRFDEPRPDVIVFGHSHIPFWGPVNGVRMFNPGSGNTRAPGATVGLLEIDADRIEARFVSV